MKINLKKKHFICTIFGIVILGVPPYTRHSLVGGKVPKCITSTTSTNKDTITIVYFILNDKKIA